MKVCVKYSELISAYADGELTESESIDVEKHLEACDSCSALLALYREISVAVVESTVPAPESLSEGVMQKIQSGDYLPGVDKSDDEDEPRSGDADKRRNVIRVMFTRYVPMAACLAIILLAIPRLLDLNRGANDMGRSEATSNQSFTGIIAGGAGDAGGSTSYNDNEAESFDDVMSAVAPRIDATRPDSPEAVPAPVEAPPSGYDSGGSTGGGSGGGSGGGGTPANTDGSFTEETQEAENGIWDDPSDRILVDEEVISTMPNPEPHPVPPQPPAHDTGLAYPLDYAGIWFSGDLPRLLRAYDAIVVDDVTRHFIVPYDDALVLIAEISGRDGVTIVLPEGDWDHAVVVYYTG